MKFVALFLVAFAIFDVCTPEVCEDEVLPDQIATQISGKDTNPDSGASCQFEEDCIACAHIIPATHFDLQVVMVVAAYTPDLSLPPADGTPSTLYHPPRS